MFHRRYCQEYLFEVSQRTNRGECLIDCNDSALSREINGILATAQARYGVAVYAYHFMSNHYHGLFGAPSPQKFSDFLSYFHGGVARLLNRYREQEGRVWGGRAHVIAVAPDEASLVQRLAYILGQGVKAGLVAHPSEFPGPSSLRWMVAGEPIAGTFVDRTAQCRDRRLVAGPKDIAEYEVKKSVQIAPLPCWAGLAGSDLHARYRLIADTLASPNNGAPSCQPHDSTNFYNEAAHLATLPSVTDETGRPRIIGNVQRRATMPRILAATRAARQAYLDLLAAFEDAYAQARQNLNRQARRLSAGKPARLVAFPQFALVGGGIRLE